MTDITGLRFSHWFVIGPVTQVDRRTGEDSKWVCRCDCGNIKEVRGYRLRNGFTKSCGKCGMFSKHGHAGKKHSPEYSTWAVMKQRCTNQNSVKYKDYGGRGITICERWLNSFENFLADMGARPPNHSIERLDNNGNYEPSNCIWATPAVQSRNNRRNRLLTHNGETMIFQDWANRLNLNRWTIKERLKRGWSVEKSLSTPPKPQPWRVK